MILKLLIFVFIGKEGGGVETVTNSIFLGSKIIADSDSIHEIKRHLLLGRNLWQT